MAGGFKPTNLYQIMEKLISAILAVSIIIKVLGVPLLLILILLFIALLFVKVVFKNNYKD
jgi:hypothetical protein